MVAPPVVTSARPLDVLAVGVSWSRRVVVATIALALVATCLPAPGHNVLVLVLVAGGLLAGLPHGSIDHRLAAGLTGWPTPVVAGGYAVVAGLVWVLMRTAGPVALLPVLVLSLLHFALGELEVIQQTTGWHPSRATAVAVAVAGTGALLLPLARSGTEFAGVAASISPLLGVLIAAPWARLALVVLWAVAAAVAVVGAVRAQRYGVVLDIVLIAALCALTPPLVAFAAWFGGWHSLRHCGRLLTVYPRSAALLSAAEPRRAVTALARAALWPSVAAVAVLAGLVVVTATSADPTAAIGTTLLVLLALTAPHMLVVLALDRRSVSTTHDRS